MVPQNLYKTPQARGLQKGFHVTFAFVQGSWFQCVTAGTFAIKRALGIHALRWRGTSGGIRLTLVNISNKEDSNSKHYLSIQNKIF